MDAVAYPQGKVFEAGRQFAITEGCVPAPEAAHGIRAAIDEALACKETGEEKVILFNYSGHGPRDPAAYEDFNPGRLAGAPGDRRSVMRAGCCSSTLASRAGPCAGRGSGTVTACLDAAFAWSWTPRTSTPTSRTRSPTTTSRCTSTRSTSHRRSGGGSGWA